MKISSKFVLRQVVNTWVVLPLADDTVNFNGMITLNESGVLLWQTLEQGADRDELVRVLTSEYNVSAETAAADVDAFLSSLTAVGCIEQ